MCAAVCCACAGMLGGEEVTPLFALRWNVFSKVHSPLLGEDACRWPAALTMFVVSFSELLYPEGSISPNSGIAAEILCRGRDYLVSYENTVIMFNYSAVMAIPPD